MLVRIESAVSDSPEGAARIWLNEAAEALRDLHGAERALHRLDGPKDRAAVAFAAGAAARIAREAADRLHRAAEILREADEPVTRDEGDADEAGPEA